MAVPTPIYTTENSKAAYQLNWSLALFWREPITAADWLTDLRQNAHARYWYNLHVCFVNDGRCLEIHRERLQLHDVILRAAAKKGHLLSRAGIVPDQLHLTLGCDVTELPAEVALSYMNNLAYACGMKRVFAFGFFVGTFGEYDLGVTWL